MNNWVLFLNFIRGAFLCPSSFGFRWFDGGLAYLNSIILGLYFLIRTQPLQVFPFHVGIVQLLPQKNRLIIRSKLCYNDHYWPLEQKQIVRVYRCLNQNQVQIYLMIILHLILWCKMIQNFNSMWLLINTRAKTGFGKKKYQHD